MINRQCPCGAWFTARRSNHIYCSPKCNAKAHYRRYPGRVYQNRKRRAMQKVLTTNQEKKTMNPEILAYFEEYAALMHRVIAKLETIENNWYNHALVIDTAKELQGDALEATWITNQIHMAFAKATLNLTNGDAFISEVSPN